MAFAKPATELLQWGLTLLLPFLVAVLLPGSGTSRRNRRWLIAAQLVGVALVLIGLILLLVLFPVVLILFFCEIFSGLLQILSSFTANAHCPDLPLAANADVLIKPGVVLLMVATVRRWVLELRANRTG